VSPGRIDLPDACRLATDVAREAGALLRARSRGRLGSRPKGTSGDVVTDLDLAAEELVLRRLRAAYPDHRIVAEESGVHEADSAWTWLVDPLDGTNNVAIGLPAYVVGLALCDAGRPVVGVVHDPVTEQTWSAVRGAGATGPHGRLAPVPRATPHGPILGWTQGHTVSRHDVHARALKLVLERHAYRLLQLWAPLLCWVMLARGDIDGFVGYHAEEVDLPAGALVATEAGLVIETFDGTPFDETVGTLAERSFVAGHPDRAGELLALVRAAARVAPSVDAALLDNPAPVVP
jgi:myo-inositol-1(or 4)-monophosphatase